MTFVAIAFLAALPLALAPILLHFFDRHRKVVIQWGAMQFLQEAAARRTSARKLQQWLLLLLRTLAIAALVFAIAGPLLPMRWTASKQRQQWIFIIDNSLSTSWKATGNARDDSGPSLTTLEQMVEELSQRIDDRPSSDSVRLLAASPHPTWLNAGSARLTPVDRDQLSGELSRLRPTATSSDLLASLLAAIQAKTDQQFQSRRVVLFTDGQAGDWRTRDQASWSRFHQTLASAAVPTKVEIVYVGDDDPIRANIAVTEVAASRTCLGPQQTVTLRALVQNFSGQPAPAMKGRWLAGDRPLHEETVPTLESGGVHESIWRVAFDQAAAHVVRYEIDATDSVAADNSNAVVIDVRNEVPILVVDGSASLASVRQDAYYLSAALGHIEGESTRWQSVYRPTTISPTQLETVELGRYFAVVIPNLSQISATAVERLEEHVTAGGALWIASGPRTDIQAFNELLYKAGAGLAPLPLETLEDYFDTQKPSIDATLHHHVANVRLKDDQRLDLSDVRVARSFRFGASDDQRDRTTILLSLSNSEPLVVENNFGRGRVFVMSSPLQMQWSDLVQAQSFVVMVEDYLAYLTAPSTPQHNLQPGDPLICGVDNEDDLTMAGVLRNPIGTESQLTPELTSRGPQFRTTRTRLPGLYTLDFANRDDDQAANGSAFSQTDSSLAFYVERPVGESKLSRLDEAGEEVLRTIAGFKGGMAQSEDFGQSQRQPLWPLLFGIVMAMVLAELLLAGIIGRARSGAASIEGDSSTASPYSTDVGRAPNATTRVPSPALSPASLTNLGDKRTHDPVDTAGSVVHQSPTL